MVNHVTETMRCYQDMLARMMEPEDRRLIRARDILVNEHMTRSQSPLMGFMYRGRPYRHSQCPNIKLHFLAVHPELYEAVEAFLSDHESIQKDIQDIHQAMMPIVWKATSMQDLRDALPEGLVSLVPELSHLPRTREEAWCLEPGSRALNQFDRVRSKMDVFTMSRLIY